MPSLAWKVVVGALALAIVAYATVFQQQLLLGLFVACLFYLVAWLTTQFRDAEVLAGVGRARIAVAVVLALLSLVYSLLVVQQILLGVIVSLTVLVVTWATSPGGPVARALQ